MSRKMKGYVGLGIAEDGRLESLQGCVGMSVDGRRDRAQPRARRVSGFYRAVAAVFLLVCSMLVTAQAAETVTYYYTSPQGTVLATADSAGNILTSADYRPYGGQALGTPEDGPGYTGHVNDADSGLVYMQARYYDPEIGRFLSIDPLGLKEGDVFASNGYAYADNNPLVNWDPFGLCPADLDNPACPSDEAPDPPQPLPRDSTPVPPSPQDATPLPRVAVTATTGRKVDMGSLPPPIFRAPEGRALFSRSIVRVLLEKADDAASNAIVKKLSFKMLKISKTGFLKPTPITFGVWALTHAEPLGGCDDKGHCADEAPISSLRNPPSGAGDGSNTPP